MNDNSDNNDNQKTLSTRTRNKIPTFKYIAYELPNDPHTYTCRPAPSSRRHEESEDDWLERTKAKYMPVDAINVRILSD